nr:PAS domain S-box protein [Halorhabdus rudnickae]
MNYRTGKIHVLHVDDEPSLTNLMSDILGREDDQISVTTATSAREGLEYLTDTDIDCIISDYDMPGQNGIEFLETVRKDWGDLPFILYTGKGSEEVAADAISAGVTDYHQKRGGAEQYRLLANRVVNAVEKSRATKYIERQNDLFTKAQNIASVGAWEYDIETDAFYNSEEVLRIHGLSPAEDITAEKSFTYYHPDDRPRIRNAFQQAIEAGESYDLELRLIDDDGNIRWVRTLGEPQTEDGKLVRVRGTIQDITEHKERQQELNEQKERAEQFFESAGNIMVVLNRDGTIGRINERGSDLLGYEQSELVGSDWFDRVIPEQIEGELDEIFSEFWKDDSETIEKNTNYIETKGGQKSFVKWHNTTLRDSQGNITGVLSTGIDITERKERQQELQRTNAVLSTLFETLPVGVLAADADRNVVAANERLFDLLNLSGSPEAVVGADFEQLLARASDLFVGSEAFLRRTNELVNSGESVHNEELSLQDGRTFARDHELLDLPEGDGHFWVYRDITEQLERETQLREMISRHETLFDNSPDMIDVLDSDGKLRDVNRRFCEELGYDENEMLGQYIWEIDQLVDAEDVTELLTDFALNERRKFDGRYERRDGSTVPIEVHLLRLDIKGEDRFLAISRDITERKQHEQQLERTNTVFRTIVENLPMGVLVEDAERDILITNDQLGEILGTPLAGEDLIGRDCWTVAKELQDRFADPERFIDVLNERVTQREPVHGEELHLADGRVLERDYLPYSLPKGEANFWLYRDITERKERARTTTTEQAS